MYIHNQDFLFCITETVIRFLRQQIGPFEIKRITIACVRSRIQILNEYRQKLIIICVQLKSFNQVTHPSDLLRSQIRNFCN